MRVGFLLLVLIIAVNANYASDCDPTKASCPENKALGKSIMLDFTKQNDAFSSLYGADRTKYTDSGLVQWYANKGDGPSLRSNFYLMYGKLEIECQTPPGIGLISNFFLQSDDGDEIDFEWISSFPTQVTTNYFGKGITGNYDRGTVNDMEFQMNNAFHTYTIDWGKDSTTWSVDGKVIRTLEASGVSNDGAHDYPKSPMRVFIGLWAGGDSASEGVVQWAGGKTSTQGAPFNFLVKSFAAVDYSTGESYVYSDKSGNEIRSNGGQINGNPNADLLGGEGQTIATSVHLLVTSMNKEATETSSSNGAQNTHTNHSSQNNAEVNYHSTQGILLVCAIIAVLVLL